MAQELPRDTIVSAFQLIEFLHSGHKFARKLLVHDVLQTAQAITATNFRPVENAEPSIKARDTRNSRAELSRFPAAWAINKLSLQETITLFRRDTKAYRDTQAFCNFDWQIFDSSQSDNLSPPPSVTSKRP